ncbi:MAG: hypothetical protein HYY52_03025 [Candidatus Melainabacteria bacterium]|nr:hypothetical protein [Candidatus Melainabacteria bacterium]
MVHTSITTSTQPIAAVTTKKGIPQVVNGRNPNGDSVIPLTATGRNTSTSNNIEEKKALGPPDRIVTLPVEKPTTRPSYDPVVRPGPSGPPTVTLPVEKPTTRPPYDPVIVPGPSGPPDVTLPVERPITPSPHDPVIGSPPTNSNPTVGVPENESPSWMTALTSLLSLWELFNSSGGGLFGSSGKGLFSSLWGSDGRDDDHYVRKGLFSSLWGSDGRDDDHYVIYK